ncbi:MAG: RNA pyrophosphohydrolase [Candidatus Portiera sp.]|nr:RNA pyrophosphohydrolase [Portiera sp.]
MLQKNIEPDQYRNNVAIVIIKKGKVLLLERVGKPGSWQFPQGGVDADEELEDAMWRELDEETGIDKKHCSIKGRTSEYLYYDLPKKYLAPEKLRVFKGQKQIWFLLELLADDSVINLNASTEEKPEFQSWQWSSYWSAIHQSVYFKQDVYRQAMTEMLTQAIKLGV